MYYRKVKVQTMKTKNELLKLLQQKIYEEKRKQALIKEIEKKIFIEKYLKSLDRKKYENLRKDLQNLSIDSFNKIYLQTFNNPYRYNIFYGGAGSGKSEFIARRYILKYLTEGGRNGLFLRKFGTDVNKSLFKLLNKVLNDYLGENKHKYVVVNKSERSFTFFNKNQIILSGLDDPEKLKSITFEYGILTDIWFEEATQGTEADFKELNRRIRGHSNGIKKEIVLSFNPVSKSNWVYTTFFNAERENKRFYTSKKDRLLILKTTILDNKYATEEDVEILKNEKDPYEKNIYFYGNFGVQTSSDNIVPYSAALRCTENKDIDDTGEIYIGLDCAALGDDSTVAKVRKGAKELDIGFELKKAEEETVLQTLTQLIFDLQNKYKQEVTVENLDGTIETKTILPNVTVNIDTTGVGFGVGSQMRTRIERGDFTNVKVNSITFGGKAIDSDKYANVVTEMYFNMRELVMSSKIYLLPDSDTITELCSRKYRVDDKTSRRVIEPKSDYRKRIKKSPDRADALVMAFYVPKTEDIWLI